MEINLTWIRISSSFYYNYSIIHKVQTSKLATTVDQNLKLIFYSDQHLTKQNQNLTTTQKAKNEPHKQIKIWTW